jgi:hypothetical protein
MADQSPAPGYQLVETGIELDALLARAATSVQPDDLLPITEAIGDIETALDEING